MGCAEREAADGVSGEGRLTLSIRMRLDSLCANHLVRDHSERTDTALGPHLGPWRLLGTEARKAAPTLPATGGTLPSWPVGHLLVDVLVVVGCML